MAGSMNSYLSQLLQIHWLRPETALWRTFDCMLMEKFGSVGGNSIDLGSGDGTMSYLMAGGAIEGYDVFKDVGQLKNYNDGADIHNQTPISSLVLNNDKLRYNFEWGVDHKDGLIKKAQRLSGFYTNMAVHDLNKKMSFDDEHFESAFSNILYWLEDIDTTLSEWHRIIKKDGKLYLLVPTASFKEKAWLYYSAPHTGDKQYLNYFDRGYSALIHHCYKTEQWTEYFKRNGFVVADHHLYLTNPVMDIWNLGTRPIAPLLINMSNMLSGEQREVAKAEWVDYFAKFFMPIIEGEFERKVGEGEASFHFFALEKR
jgi:SAM-dependent methyltransferase